MTEEAPRIHAIVAGCCGNRIVNFDLPSRAPVKLATTATEHGWTLSRDGSWVCADHAGETQ